MLTRHDDQIPSFIHSRVPSPLPPQEQLLAWVQRVQQELAPQPPHDDVPWPAAQLSEEAREALWNIIQAFIPMVKRIVATFNVRSDSEREDLIQEGILGIIMAVARYDAQRGTRLSTFVYPWVLYRVQCAYSTTREWGYFSSRYMRRLYQLAQLERSRFADQHGREPTIAELAQALHKPLRLVDRLLSEHPAILLSHIEDEDSKRADDERIEASPLLNAVSITEPDNVLEALVQESHLALCEIINQYIDAFSEPDRTILAMHYGFPPYDKPAPLKAIAQRLALPFSHVRSIHAQALKRLRKMIASHQAMLWDEHSDRG